MPATHREFKTLIPAVADAEAMNTVVGRAICHQHLFDRKTSPRELGLWAPGELQEFIISLPCVDRLYHIHRSENDIFELVVRVDYKDRHLFVELSCSCYFEAFECHGAGQIYVSYSARLFTKVITTRMQTVVFYESLAQDGYLVEGQVEHERWPSSRWHIPPPLKTLTHLAISRHRASLSHYPEALPTALIHSTEEFMETQGAIKDYDEWE